MLVTLPGIIIDQAGATEERPVPDAADVVGNRDAGQATARFECIVPDASDAGRDYYTGQVRAAIERPVPDVGDAVGNRDAGQADSINECQVSNGGDWQTSDHIWDGHCTAGASVSRDGDGAVIGDVSELGLRRCRPCQHQ